MGWIVKHKDHAHDYPRYVDINDDAGRYSVWECNCKRKFMVVGYKLGRSDLLYKWQEVGKRNAPIGYGSL